MKAVDRVVATLLMLALVAACGLVGRLDQQDVEKDRANYCAMVRAYKKDPTVGWPDYRHTYKTECKRYDHQQ